jgi:hypothetical protein
MSEYWITFEGVMEVKGAWEEGKGPGGVKGF